MSTRLIHGHPSVPGQTEGRGPASTCSSLSPAHLNTWYNCLLSCLTKTSPPLTPLPYIQTESTVKSYQFILKSLPSAISFHLNFQHPGPSHHPFLPELLQQPLCVLASLSHPASSLPAPPARSTAAHLHARLQGHSSAPQTGMASPLSSPALCLSSQASV